MNKKKGLFITFEGPEASGKSSQIILLEKYLKKNKIPFIITREPGGTKLAESLRNLILKVKSDINIQEEILLLMAARSHHINNVIIPSLKKLVFEYKIVGIKHIIIISLSFLIIIVYNLLFFVSFQHYAPYSRKIQLL